MSDSNKIELYDQPSDLLSEFKQKNKNLNRQSDVGIVNEQTGSSISIRSNGDAVIASNEHAQYKLSHDNGSATEISYQSNTITNRKRVLADEIIINEHKMNPQLYELSDMKQLFNNPDQAMGNLTMIGSVLVKAWDEGLKKYVLIRRQVRIPLFSASLNIPDAPTAFDIDSNMKEEMNILTSK